MKYCEGSNPEEYCAEFSRNWAIIDRGLKMAAMNGTATQCKGLTHCPWCGGLLAKRTDPTPTIANEVFDFKPPAWVNGDRVDTAEESLERAADMALCIYPMGVQTGIHAMIEWCGVMTEYVKMLEESAKSGLDPRSIDKHHETAPVVPDFMVAYFCEKLGCQIIPFIRGNREMWRTQIEGWFKEAEPAIKNDLMIYVCQICGYETNNPRVVNEYSIKNRCIDLCCDGPMFPRGYPITQQ